MGGGRENGGERREGEGPRSRYYYWFPNQCSLFWAWPQTSPSQQLVRAPTTSKIDQIVSHPQASSKFHYQLTAKRRKEFLIMSIILKPVLVLFLASFRNICRIYYHFLCQSVQTMVWNLWVSWYGYSHSQGYEVDWDCFLVHLPTRNWPPITLI